MNLKNRLFTKLCAVQLKNNELSLANPGLLQREQFDILLNGGLETQFGKEHKFDAIDVSISADGAVTRDYERSLKNFRSFIPIRDYNAIYPYINRLRDGSDYVLWNEKVKWFAKSSGTSSDKSKYIPVTPSSLNRNHYGGFRSMLGAYINLYPNSNIFGGKSLTLGGSVAPDICNGKFSGDLSAILLSNSPRAAEIFRSPNQKVALISDFTTKVKAIANECIDKNITSFAGVPSWNLILMNEILKLSGKQNLIEVWPNMELFMHGGIGFGPYRSIFNSLFPSDNMHYMENYNASEGYFAFQDNLSVGAMSFTCGNGVYYEFVRMDDLSGVLEKEKGEYYNLPAVSIEEVECNVNYAVVISTVGGLWRYLIGDTVKFVQLDPRRFIITGRTKLCINAFGEELMIDNAEKALVEACKKHNVNVVEYTVAPVFMEFNGSATKGAHKWLIEFESEPASLEQFADTLDKELTLQNSDYEAKRSGNATMERLQLVSVPHGTFYRWMEQRGKVGGQNKVPRLCCTSRYIDELEQAQKL